jgi:hypothetical protein
MNDKSHSTSLNTNTNGNFLHTNEILRDQTIFTEHEQGE